MLFFVTRREVTDVSVVRWSPNIIVIGLIKVSFAFENERRISTLVNMVLVP